MAKKTILIADDETNIRLLLKSMLGIEYNVVEAVDGYQAVVAARKSKPDLILMDIMMPGFDGYTAVNEMRHEESLHNTPILVVSVLGSPLNKTLAEQLGVNGYITKPFTSDEIIDAIRKYLPAN